MYERFVDDKPQFDLGNLRSHRKTMQCVIANWLLVFELVVRQRLNACEGYFSLKDFHAWAACKIQRNNYHHTDIRGHLWLTGRIGMSKIIELEVALTYSSQFSTRYDLSVYDDRITFCIII